MTTSPTRPIHLQTFAVANYFLELAWSRGEYPNQQKLQRLVYYAHGWHLALAHAYLPLLDEPVLALHYGPILQSLADEFAAFGIDRITRLARTFWEPCPVRGMDWHRIGSTLATPRLRKGYDDPCREILDEVWRLYGAYPGSQLSNMAHSEGTPWHRVYQAYAEHLPANAVIPNEWIKEHFAQLQSMPSPREAIP